MTLPFEQLIERAKTGKVITWSETVSILHKLQEVLITEENVLTLRSPIIIVGDIHGQLSDVNYLFEKVDGPEHKRFLFMGDYVDRGNHSINTFLLLALYKLKYPGCFYLLRGNHESRHTSIQYGFYRECQQAYGCDGAFETFEATFDLLPCAALVDNRVFSVHGGLSPSLPFVEMINGEKRWHENTCPSPLADLYWSDPEPSCSKWRPNSRGEGWCFGPDAVNKFVHCNRLSLITRSHQLAQGGYIWMFPDEHTKPDEGRLVLVWSAPNYAYRNGNLASVMKYGFCEGNPYELIVFDAVPDEKRVKVACEQSPVSKEYFV